MRDFDRGGLRRVRTVHRILADRLRVNLADGAIGRLRWIGGAHHVTVFQHGALALQYLYHVPVELDLTKAREVSQLVQKCGNYKVDTWKPVVGEFIFTRESGGVASQFHMPSAIEPYSATVVGADRKIALGKKAGLANIKIKLDELGLDAPAQKHAAILEKVKSKGMVEKRLVTDQEFRTIVAQVV